MGKMVADNFLNNLVGRRILVTGHTGFKGSWLTLILKELDATILGFSLAPEVEPSHFSLLKLENLINHVEGDLRDFKKLSQVMQEFQPEIVFHLAAQAIVSKSYSDPKNTFDTNIGGSVNVLEAVRLCNSVRSLVFITSDKCYENVEWIWGYRENDRLGGRDPYSASKAAAEIIFSSYCRSFFASRQDFGAASARAGNVIGGGDWALDRIVPDCIRSLHENKPVFLRNPASTRPWQHVLEPLSGYLTLASGLLRNPDFYSGAWNFGPHLDQARSVLDLTEKVIEFFGKGSIELSSVTASNHEAKMLQLNCDKAVQLLKWNPRWDFEQTVSETVAWYKHILAGGEAREISIKQIRKYFTELK